MICEMICISKQQDRESVHVLIILEIALSKPLSKTIICFLIVKGLLFTELNPEEPLYFLLFYIIAPSTYPAFLD